MAQQNDGQIIARKHEQLKVIEGCQCGDARCAAGVPFAPRRAKTLPTLHPRDHDPRHFPYGLLLVESAMWGGANGFVWFNSQSAAAHYLRVAIWDELGVAWQARHPGIRERYQSALSRRSDFSQRWLQEVESDQDALMVMWFGTFKELYRGEGAMERVIHEAYYDSVQGVRSASPALGAFIEFLRSYQR